MLVLLLAACEDAAPPVPGSLTILMGDNQTSVVETPVAIKPAVMVKTTKGKPMRGVEVTFTVINGGGALSGGFTRTGNSGMAHVDRWTLGHTPGTNRLRASVDGLAPVIFSATATVGPPSLVTLVAGADQTGVVGTAVAIPPEVLVTDSHENPVPDAQVAFTAVSKTAIVTGPTPVSDETGHARVGSWVLGHAVGTQLLRATVWDLPPVTFKATALAGPPAFVISGQGADQSGPIGEALPVAPSVVVTDEFGNPLPGITVTFSVATGGGSITGATQETDTSGVAAVGSWTLGTRAGRQTLTASVPDLQPLTIGGHGVAGSADDDSRQ